MQSIVNHTTFIIIKSHSCESEYFFYINSFFNYLLIGSVCIVLLCTRLLMIERVQPFDFELIKSQSR